MPGNRFLDTNILVYSYAAQDECTSIAESLVMEGGIIGVQVISEFVNVMRRKMNWKWDQVQLALVSIENLLGPARPLTRRIQAHGFTLARDYNLSIYDALNRSRRLRCRLL